MRYLLDTHALLWWWTDDSQLSPLARAAIELQTNKILVSAASAWEIATKLRLGKLAEADEAVRRFNELVAADGFEHLPISYLHALRAGNYECQHRDPFDRMLAAQAELDALVLLTCDPVFAACGTRVAW
ncbi:MAG: type II toxin-antitoxin system VapC family toxin [Rhodocyclaceae bacterium]|nr:type II toxin-antitoxin system VapC family toxin [Rhodocyclaceae bacterium]